MRKVVFGLVALFIVSQFLVSCGSENEILGQFSKRKYLKKYKAKEVKYEDKVGEVENNLAFEQSKAVAKETVLASNTESVVITKEESIQNIEEAVLTEKQLSAISKITNTPKDYSSWNNYNRNMNFSKEMAVQHHNKTSVSGNKASEILIAILCFFLPPVAVVVFEDGVTTNFWVDLVATLLFWLPGMILAFLICFAGVSF